MNAQMVEHLSTKYSVAPSIIRTLASLSRIWQEATTEEFQARTLRIYNKIVTEKCGGIDPLV